ncbi:type I-E CRISPR-associated endoribonuclease Cas2e [Limosilactobacillus fastidiosus]|uniref:Type I-E CRISPR-associated endoribonuclease Cas2 n=1 Tax=Limosilactobacillus fastidiosus TaxID=2759855 RepID=A0ABR6E6Q9_9LACO|nr:type I-E CRISPR-associated endoribonuclease Cas2e [Limosilactobacillus fastidiosus]MBB1062866.1 type I-E CRISPR-associated endoribonuclease Cas2 [Limosilactobacillus fastidiosus]MCD7084090.1 type I-E CRISPR-associated endoribonuclease Cas2e [Limosilactobacillus fastidiosus]
MIVITLTKVPASLRGDLTKWCQEIQSGVYVGNVNARVREHLWERINKNIGQGEATLVYNTNNELGYIFRTTRSDREIIDSDGIPLMESLFKSQDNRRRGFSNAYRYHKARIIPRKKQHQFISLDIETTGLTPSHNQIISIGAVKMNKDFETFYRLVKLEKGNKLPEDISRVTGLNDHLLNTKGVLIKDAIIDLKSFISDMPVVGYNLTFDERFLRTAIVKNRLIQLNNKMIDLLPYVKKVNKFSDNYHLSTILNQYNIINEHPHNSLSDAKATMELTKKLIEKYGFTI